MFINKKINFKKGFSLVEILVGSSIICLSLVLIINLETSVSRIGFGSLDRVQATMLGEEGVIAIRNMRNSSWNNISSLSDNIKYRIYWSDTSKTWQATTTLILIDNKFDRTVTFYPVNRDVNNFDIVTSGGALDTGTRKFLIEVLWSDSNGTTSKSFSSYIYNIYNK